MPKTVTATYTGGIIRPEKPLRLQEGERVLVTIKPAQERGGAKATPTGKLSARRRRALERIREITARHARVFRGVRFTREELHERR